MAIAARQFVFFNTNCESSFFDKLSIVDGSDYFGEGIDPADVTGTWTVTAPDGSITVIIADTSGNPTSTPMLLDSNGDYLEGTFTFLYTIVVTGVVQPGTYSQTIVYDFCPQMAFTPGSCTPPCIDITANCFCLKITARDETNYGTPTTISRVMTLFPPASLSLPSEVTNDDTLVYDFSYTGGYEVQVNTFLQYVNTSGNVIVEARVKGSVFKDIKCDRNLCALYNCIKKFYAKLRYNAGQSGGLSTLTSFQQEQWDNVIAYSIQFENALKCGQYADADTFYDKLKEIVDCDCGCQEGNEPQLVNPYCGGGAGSSTTTVVAGTGNIEVTSNTVGSTTTYTVGMTSGFLALIVGIQNDITAIEGDITTIQAQIAAIAEKQYYKLSDSAGVAENIANTSEQVLRTYTLPEDTLAIGDTLIVTSVYRFNLNTNNKTVKLLFGGSGAQINLTGTSARPSLASGSIKIELRFTKTQANQLLREVTYWNFLGFPAIQTGPNSDYPSDPNSTGNVAIEATGQSPVAGTAGDINCTRLTVEHIKAV